MSQSSSLMEWIEQTKKLAKVVDYICIDTVDSIVTCIPFLKRSAMIQHKDFFIYFCELYHKPDPLQIMLYLPDMDLKKVPHAEQIKWKTCKSLLAQYVENSIKRCKRLMESIDWQWFELVDFMFERPELVNPFVIDDYIRDKINSVCKNHKKNNPFKSGFDEKFGKFWKSKNGRWMKERRERF